jgi:hypothetical protein
MTPPSWIESTVSERIANLRGEAEQQRLALRWHAAWPGPERCRQAGGRS